MTQHPKTSALQRTLLGLVAALALVSAVAPAQADEAAIRKTLQQRLPKFPKIDEIRKTPVPGLYELRIGTDVIYSDETGQHLIQGQITETKQGQNLTQARIDQLTAIDVAKLPLKDAIVWKQGTGARKLVVFADPNCGYCKRFERDLQNVKDVTVYTFLYPILGGDSPEKSKAIWCAKDNTKAWRDWMIDGTVPTGAAADSCDAGALQRNAALGRKHKINGTPALVFADGKRIPGALSAEQLEQQFVRSGAKS
jgi:thiol:disulfide interchange protein DsbC